MRARHTAHPLPAFPVYSAAFVSDNELVLGGGGGASRSGIKNKLRLYNVSKDREIELVNELELEKGEDAPMSMAAHIESRQIICGVNSTMERLEKGENENCRVYGVKENVLTLIDTRGTLTTGDLEDYQKVTVLSPDGNLLAIAGSHDLSLLSYPSLSPASESIHVAKGEIYDATLSSSASRLVIATTVNLLVYALPEQAETASFPSKSKKKGKQKATPPPKLQLLKTIELPALSGASFRAARFHPTNDKILYAVLNTVPSRSKKSKSTARQAFVWKLNTDTWTWEDSNKRKVSDKGLTCFDVSSDGKFLAFGTSDYTITVLDSISLSPLLAILKAHDFPPTTLRFNPTSTLLVSGSADNSVRIVTIPDSLGGQSWGTTILVLIALLVILLAITVQFLMK